MLQLRSSFGIMPLAAVAMFLVYPAIGRADLVIAAESVTVNPGTSGNSLEISLQNTGPSAVTLAGFSFEISIGNPDITLTEALISTSLNPYIFAGHSLFGPEIDTSNTGQVLQASDIYDIIFGGATIGAGTTVGLGLVLFDVASAAGSGATLVTLGGFPATSLSDALGADVSIDTLTNGQITIQPSASVPEQSSVTLLLTLLPLIGCAHWLLSKSTHRFSRQHYD